MRVLLINETARVHTGGVNRVVVETSHWLQRLGHEVGIACWDGQPGETAGKLFQLPLSKTAPDFEAAIKKVAADFKPDVAQLHGGDSPWLCGPIARLMPACRYVHDQSWFCSGGDRMSSELAPCHRPHGVSCLFWHYAQGCGGKNPLGNWRRWQLVTRKSAGKRTPALRFQVASEFMRASLVENGYDSKKTDVVPLFASAPLTQAAAVPGLLLAACRLVRAKGIHVLIKALATLPANLPCQLAIAGTGPELPALRELAARLPLASPVKFLGELPPAELDSWYARAQIIISPTLRPEPFGLVGLEAMAHGKPVLAFPGGATEEWLRDGETGVVVRERTAKALGQGIVKLLGRPELIHRLGTQARKRWELYRPELFIERLTASFARCREDFHRPSVPS